MTELQDSVMKQLHAWRLEARTELFEIVLHNIVFTPCELFSEGDWDLNRSKLTDWILDMCTWRVDFKTKMGRFGYERFHASFHFEMLRRN